MYKLSKPQESIFEMSRFSNDSVTNIAGDIFFNFPVSVDEARDTAYKYFQICDTFFTQIVMVDGVPMQQTVYKEVNLEDICVREFDTYIEYENWAKADAVKPIDVFECLYRLSVIKIGEKVGFYCVTHHIINDATSFNIMARFACEYLKGNKEQFFYSYKEYLDAEKKYEQSSRYEKDKDYWINIYNNGEINFLVEKDAVNKKASRKSCYINEGLSKKIKKFCENNEITEYAFFLTAIAAYYSRITQKNNFFIGSPVLNRNSIKDQKTMGVFINTVPIGFSFEGDELFPYLCSKTSDNVFSAFRHQKYHYSQLLKDINKHYGTSKKMFDVVVSFLNTKTADGAEIGWFSNCSQVESLQIHIDDRRSEGVYHVNYDYQTEKFTEHDIDLLHEHICTLLSDALENENKKLCELEMLTSDEKKKLLYDFNNTKAEYPRDKCVHELFEEIVEKNPDKIAVVACDKTLTYKELNEEANRIAHALIEKGVGRGDIVAFKLARRSYLIATMIGILKAGAAYMPVDPDYPHERIEYMLEDSGAKHCVTEENIYDLLGNPNSYNPDVIVESTDICYCIYTSGSTGNPKAAMIRHNNLMNFCNDTPVNNLQHYIARQCSAVLACGSIVFDISNFEIFLSLLLNKSVILANEQEVTNANSLAALIRNNCIDCVHCTPTKLRTYFYSKEFSSSFRNVKCVMVGGEQFTKDIYDTICSFSDAKIFNGYGPTETTMGVGFGEVNDDIITIGKPIANTQIYIVDKYMKPVPIGVTGEICIAGDCVGAGYLNRPELTAEKFIDNPFGEGKMYRTGDLAYWREDGNIIFVGRNDFQVKIRGLRIELGEIENAISGVDGINMSVVVVRKDGQDRQIICAFYTGEEKSAKELREEMSKSLPKYMVPHIFTHLPEMPMTSSGKTNRNALPEVDLDSIETSIEYVAPETEEEAVLIECIEDVLGIERVSILDNFFDIGGDSLKSIELTSRLEIKGYEVQVKTIFASQDIRDLAKELTAKEKAEIKVEYDNVLPATAAQMRVYTAQIMMSDAPLYNIPYVFMTEEVNGERLEKAVNKLIERHDSLRTHFENRDGQIVQVIDEKAEVIVEKLKDADVLSFIKPFDLTKSPLVRVGYYKNTVVIDIHHIITDGETMPVFFRELNELYMEREIEREPVQYGDFASKESNFKESEKYWLKVFKEEVPVLQLPTDYPRKEKQTFNGSAHYDLIDIKLHDRIRNKCKKIGITPYVYYMTCFNIMLSKYSGNEDIVVGMPISGRSSRFLETVGMFVNTIVLRSKPEGNKRILDLMKEIRDNSIEAIDNQNYPFGELVKKLNIEVGGRNPLYDVMLAYQSYEMTDIVFGDKKAELIPTPITASKSDFTFSILPRKDNVVVMVEYCTDLYKELKIEKFTESFKLILEKCLDEQTLIKDIEAATDDEKKKVLYNFNNTAADYPRDKCIHELFEDQAEKLPHKTAVVACDKTLTYRELNEEANRIAHSLMEKGIGKGDIVGLMLPRKSYLLSALFGILKTGAAYLPIDSELPRERIEYMCEDTHARLVVSSENIDSLMQSDNISNPLTEMTNDALCYCIYTSGSTGKPKGVMAKHRNVVNYISKNEHNIAGKIIKDDFEAIVSISTCSFDIFVTETVLPLVNGLRTVLADEQQCRNQSALNKLLSKEKGEFLQTTPTKLKVLTSEPSQRNFLKNIKAILLGGEAMELSFLRELKGMTNAKIYNIYGVTEVPIWSTFADTDIFTDVVTIGNPIANTRVYIVDKYMKPVPIGVTGELCIAGDSVSAGYLNRPELTLEKFVDNPFGEGKMYRTGDLAYWREDGNIVYVGRRDFQVKIRGLRIELGEIESVLQGVDNIDRAVAVVRKAKDGRQLICAFYTGEERSAKELREEMSKSLPKYMVPHIFTHLEEMPMTSSGKANRNALPEIDLENFDTETEYVEAETEKEKVLIECVEDVLGAERVSVLDNFFDIGGDSLKSIELTARLEAKGYDVSVKTVFVCKNIRELALALTEKKEEYIKVEYGSVIPAAPAQMRVYTAQMLAPNSTLYNVTYAFKTDDIDISRLEYAINKLIARHESLRTHFENINGVIHQVIDKDKKISVEEISEENIHLFTKAFDLSRSPLVRVGCSEDTVIVDMHHIIVDGETMPVFFRELNELYMGRELSDTVQYGEFAVKDGYTQENEKYWLDVFNQEVPDLVLPMDFARKESQTFNGSVHYELIDISLHERIKEKCKKLDITPYVFYMTCFNIMLSKYSGNEDIVVGMPISGRSSRFLETVGMFVNTIALRSKPEGNKRIIDLMNEIRDNSVSAIDNQNYPFGELVKKLNIEVGGRNPLYDVMLAYQSFEMTDITFADRKAELIPLTTNTSKCDISFNILPRENDVVLVAEYCTDLYTERTVQKLTDSFRIILEKALDENSLIKDIDILSQEQKKLLREFNGTTVNYNISDYSTIYSLFEENAAENKSKVCISTAEGSITFGELLSLSEVLDKKIRGITDNKKSVIAVIADRSIEMYAAIYGIIRGGNAYLPISPEYPKERIEYILKNSSAALVVAQDKYIHLAGSVPCVDMTVFINNPPANNENLPCAAKPDDTAYVIYTSGSTGNPKGAKISHKSAVNRILWMHDKYPLEENGVILQKTPYTFDVSVWELFWWGMCGGRLAASKPGEHFLPAKILGEVKDHKVTHLHFVPSVFDLFLNYLESHKEECNKFCSVKHVFLSGEALTASLVQRFYALYDYNSVKLHNLYGPTECAVDVTYYDCSPDDVDPVPIGKPIHNTAMYVVDKYMNIVPIGVTGELCIGGINVGQGYLNNKQLTAEKFIDNPFGEGKLYKTGDLAYWREDGQIIFCGRMDGQVKLGGQRIEIGEIEAVIGNIPEVESVAVIMRKLNGRDALVAFYCGKNDNEKAIKNICEAKLPKYMVPAAVCQIEEMPLNQSGKLDRKALSALEVDLNEFDGFEEPINEYEKTICDAFREVLEEEKIGRNSNFFELGGSSLSMISFLSQDMFKDITPSDFISNPTPKKLAKLITDKKKSELKYLETLWEAEKTEKAIVLLPFAGGGAEAYTGFVNSVKAKSSNTSLYFVRYLHTKDKCKEAAREISDILGNADVYFYSHCVGSAVAMQILRCLEKDNLCNVKHYIAGASMPPKKPQKKNVWDIVPDKVLKAVLVKAGAPLNAISDEKAFEMLKNFRADTDFATQAFAENRNKIKVPVSVVISKRDMFTSNYKQAEKIWKKYAETVKDIYFIDSPTHYFQSDNSEELVELIFSITD